MLPSIQGVLHSVSGRNAVTGHVNGRRPQLVDTVETPQSGAGVTDAGVVRSPLQGYSSPATHCRLVAVRSVVLRLVNSLDRLSSSYAVDG